MNPTRKLLTLVGCAVLSACDASRAETLTGADDSELAELKASYRHKVWEVIDARSGDCHMTGVLTLFDNGRAIWTASSRTDSTGFADIWHESLKVSDDAGRVLFGFGVWDSPGMQDDGSHHFWRKTGEFPKELFDAATMVTSSGDC